LHIEKQDFVAKEETFALSWKHNCEVGRLFLFDFYLFDFYLFDFCLFNNSFLTPVMFDSKLGRFQGTRQFARLFCFDSEKKKNSITMRKRHLFLIYFQKIYFLWNHFNSNLLFLARNCPCEQWLKEELGTS
jgi:hypothetical protein